MAGAAVHVQILSGHVGHHDPVGRLLEEVAEPFFAFPQCSFGSLALRDVEHDAGDLSRGAARIGKHLRSDCDPGLARRQRAMDTAFELIGTPVADSLLDGTFHALFVLGVNQREKGGEGAAETHG